MRPGSLMINEWSDRKNRKSHIQRPERAIGLIPTLVPMNNSILPRALGLARALIASDVGRGVYILEIANRYKCVVNPFAFVKAFQYCICTCNNLPCRREGKRARTKGGLYRFIYSTFRPFELILSEINYDGIWCFSIYDGWNFSRWNYANYTLSEKCQGSCGETV